MSLPHLQERAEGRRHGVWVADWVLHDVVDEAVDGVGVEGRLPDVQLVEDHAKGPQVRLR